MPPPKGTGNPLEGPGDYSMTEQVHSDTYSAIDPTKADLNDKAVYISGASRGIGKAIALSYAKAGASFIAISARSSLTEVENEIKRAATDAGREEPHTLSVKVDVTDPESVKNAGIEIERAFGKLDIVVNNAGIIGDLTPIVSGNPDNWWYLWNVNIRGPYLITRACIPLLLKGELKTIINTASVGAHLVRPGLSDYQTAKLALLRFTEFTATEHADGGIIAIAIHPGNVPTDIFGAFGGVESMPEILRNVIIDTPALCGDSLVYLTKERREWLSGRYVNVTWDMPEFVSESKQKLIVDGDMLKVKLVVP